MDSGVGQAVQRKPRRLRYPPCSPVIRQIRQACAEPFEAFEQCLRQNEAAVGNCAEHMRSFLQCAEQVQPPSPSATVQVKTWCHPQPYPPNVDLDVHPESTILSLLAPFTAPALGQQHASQDIYPTVPLTSLNP